MMKTVKLKNQKLSLVENRHPWVFSGAVLPLSKEIQAGEMVRVESEGGAFVGIALASPRCDIILRFISFSEQFDPKTFIEERLRAAYSERQALVPSSLSNAFRLVNAEADGLPGLVIDCFHDTCVIQISTSAMASRRDEIVSMLTRGLGFSHVYEKSEAASRKLEGLTAKSVGWLSPEPPANILMHEHGLNYHVDVVKGQKTGFFIDQREMRLFVRQIAREKSVLNCFAYTGGFSLNALLGGATSVVSIDSSELACESIREHLDINGFSNEKRHELVLGDVVDFLRNSERNFDVIVLDPPPYVKKAKDLKSGFGHYLELNRLAMARLNTGGILLSFSCSPFMPDADFQKLVFMASRQARRNLRIIGRHRHALDHPVSIFHPEGSYLKGMILKEGCFDYL